MIIDMAEMNIPMEKLSTEMNRMGLNPCKPTSTNTSDYYTRQHETSRTSFARLEKGLLLMTYVYETSKSSLMSELALWNHRICISVIKKGQCNKPRGVCHHEHQTMFRQPNLCAKWYINNGCTKNANCCDDHQLKNVPSFHEVLDTSTDADVYNLIQFVRNFCGHYIGSVISETQALYREITIIMVHLVHALSQKHIQSIEHLYLFLEKTTIQQLIPKVDLLANLEQSFNVSDVFFDKRMNFRSDWYRSNSNKRSINFNNLSPRFVRHFNRILTEYYHERLKSRGAKAAWS
jgi:hypothetical protein